MVWFASPTTHTSCRPPEPRVQHALLQRADVLVLVDDEVPVAGPHLVGDVAVLLDGAQHRAVGLDPTAGGRRGHQPQLVLGQLGHRPAEHSRCEVAQLAQRRRVEGSGLHAGHGQRSQPGAHLAGGPSGEGDGEDPAGRCRAGVHGVGNAVGDGAGLPCSGAGQDAHRPGQGADRLDPLRIEAGQHPLGGAGGGVDSHFGIVAAGADGKPAGRRAVVPGTTDESNEDECEPPPRARPP